MSNKMSQKECVFSAVQAFLSENNREHELDAGQPILFNKSEKQTIVGMVCAAREVMELSAEADAKFDTDQKFKTYTIGLVNNWLRKDKRLNGGTKYEIKNPGSRAGTGNEQVKALRALKGTLTDPAQIEQVQAAIDSTLAALKVSKPSAPINIDALPEKFRHLVIVK